MSCRNDPACRKALSTFPKGESVEAHSVKCARERLVREIAEWLVGAGFPFDFGIEGPTPRALWEAVVDVAHEDKDGTLHNNELTRAEVESWLLEEGGAIGVRVLP